MKKLILALLLLVSPIIGPAPAAPDIEIVESIPAGTSLDNPEIRDTREVWLEMIGEARKTLDLEEYYISDEPGKMLEDVLAAIYSAAGRGVKVRVLVDARMVRTYPESVDGLSRRRNVEVRRIDFGAIAGGMQHAKYFIVDGKQVFVGSQNFDTFDGAKPRFLNRGKKRRSVSTLSIPRASARGVEWVDWRALEHIHIGKYKTTRYALK